MFQYDFKWTYSLVIEFFVRLIGPKILSIEPYSITYFEVVWSSSMIIEPLHILCCLLQSGFCLLKYPLHLFYELSCFSLFPFSQWFGSHCRLVPFHCLKWGSSGQSQF